MTQKLKTYNAEAEVPTEHKGFYAQSPSGKWEPQFEGVESVSSVLSKNSELLGKVAGHATEIAGKDAEIQRLTSQLANASSSTIPRGHEAVPKADADLARAVKEAGIATPDAFKTLHTEHGKYKTKAEGAQKRERLDKLRKDMKWNESAVDVLSLIPDLPEVEDRDVTANGKTEKVPHAKIVTKTAAGDEVSYKPFADYFKEKHAALLPSVLAKREEGTPFFTQGDGEPRKDEPLSAGLMTEWWGENAKPAAAGK